MNKPTPKQIWAVVGGLVIVGGLIAVGWALDEHWTPREIHKITTEQIKAEHKITTDQIYADMNQFQKNMALEKARENVAYWSRLQWEMQNACDQAPNNRNLQIKLQRVTEEKRKAEQRFRDVERKY